LIVTFLRDTPYYFLSAFNNSGACSDAVIYQPKNALDALSAKVGTLSLEAQTKLEKDTAKKEAKAEAKADAEAKRKQAS
jgi:hypothetical protein